MVVSHSTGRVPASGQRRAPRRSRTAGGASVAHSLIASSEVSPVSTAQAASARQHVRQAMAPAARLARVGNLGQPGQQSGQFVLGGARLTAELAKDGRDRRKHDGRHGLP